MKIGILGTRGIPNHYGGFEQLAEYLSVALVQRGHAVHVYNSTQHPYRDKTYKGVEILHCPDPEKKLGTFGQFIYDFNCIRDARTRDFDVLLQLGYTSSSVWSFMLPRRAKIITNMDGMEWKRSKYSPAVQRFLHRAESWAVHSSDLLVADSIAIQAYLKQKYDADAAFIPYGANVCFDANDTFLNKYGLQKKKYYLLIARFGPENNIEMILKGYLASKSTLPLLLIGSTQNNYGRHISGLYKSDRIKYAGTVYDIDQLNSLRYFSKMYFHGHSVGGTNPSLLEAMASQSYICAHRNEFNQAVLGDDACYFSSEAEVSTCINGQDNLPEQDQVIIRNLRKIEESYSWTNIVDAYEKQMLSIR